jgi:periplasmic protein TonB
MAKDDNKTDGEESTGTIGQGPIDRLVLESTPVPDRLPPMLFLAALVHGILIIGVTFNAVLGDEFDKAISLEVTIVADPDSNVLEPEHAEYLAQANQEGSGNTLEQARPSARAESAVPVDNLGIFDGDSLRETTPIEDNSDQVLTAHSDQDPDVRDDPREVPSPEEALAANLEAGIELTMPLPQDNLNNLAIHDPNPRELVTSVDTKESRIAGYLNRWKTKIESVGTKYFPLDVLADGFAGSPTLEVTINASGQLQEAFVRKSSGSKTLDQVALNILRRAAPFDPFPEAVRIDYDRMRFAYKWRFRRIDVQTAAQRN